MKHKDNIDDLSDLWEKEDFDKKQKTRRHPVLLLILVLVLALAAGGACTFLLYGTDLWYDAYSLAGRTGLIPGYEKKEPFDRDEYADSKKAEDEPKSSDDGIEHDIPNGNPDTEDETAEEETIPQHEFVPVENPPTLEIVNAGGSELGVSEIHDKLLDSVVAILGYAEEDKRMGYSLGSGVIMSPDGYIITNCHVIEKAWSIEVVLSNGEYLPAELIANDSTADVAILKVQGENLPAAEFGNSQNLKVGDQVVAIGCPASLELQGTTTVGNISAVRRRVTMDSSGNSMYFIQTDASVNPGNSGGPLINKYGQVIGIITAKLSAYTYEGIGFAIPAEDLVNITADLFAYGHVTGYPSIGIMAKGVLENEMGNHPEGVYVDSISKGSGAEGKLLPGDIIITVEGKEVYTVADVNMIKANFGVGDTLHMSVWRMNETIDVDIILVDKYDID